MYCRCSAPGREIDEFHRSLDSRGEYIPVTIHMHQISGRKQLHSQAYAVFAIDQMPEFQVAGLF